MLRGLWLGRRVRPKVGAFVLYVIHCFPATYTIMMHRTATILGQWAKIEGRVSPTFYNQYVHSKINICYVASLILLIVLN